ncbi:avidin/streptavidin family protein [Bradyrhizobium genosp. P]|uniref:avidin/streptavidin family protein n=1 Tax=Bradyrhizobium genosp. P TaxID=83641 RepID=UPI003CF06092
MAVNSYDQSTGAISGTYTNNATNSCDEGAPQAMTGWLAQANSGTAISFTVNFGGCGSTTVWTGQLNAASGFQGLWLLSLAVPVVWNGISAGADTFTFGSGDKSKLISAGGGRPRTGQAKSSPTRKIANSTTFRVTTFNVVTPKTPTECAFAPKAHYNPGAVHS